MVLSSGYGDQPETKSTKPSKKKKAAEKVEEEGQKGTSNKGEAGAGDHDDAELYPNGWFYCHQCEKKRGNESE